jgi:hypothetical protein
MRKFSFTRWLTTKETFNSFTAYKQWLSILSKEESKQTDLYYHEKYQYFLKYLQTEWD